MGFKTGNAKRKPTGKSDDQVLAEAEAILAQRRATSAQVEAASKPEAISLPKEISLPEKFFEAAASIRERQPLTSELAFMAKHLVQVTLPHSDPGDVPLWTKTNGDFTLVIARTGVDDAGKPIGYPYGVIPRLLLYWITSEAVRNKNRLDGNPRLLELGQNLADFMRDVGLDPSQGGGKRSDARRLKDQMTRLFSSSIGFQYSRKSEGMVGQSSLGMLIAPRRELWWDPKNLAQGNLWQSWIELGQDFYNAIITSAVPVDVRALKALRKSPLALDLYGWATYKTFSLFKQNQPQFVG